MRASRFVSTRRKLILSRAGAPSNKRMDLPSAYASKGSGMVERLALIRVRSPNGVARGRVARRSCANR